jgi:hypothetical protein|tara:strand:+ start:739 stop:882 length:144 start_codon:yes stop_codon:yes gene_type:complete
MMQVNTDSVSMLHKAVLETELHNINSSTPVVVKEWLMKRVEELSYNI